jgi:hypothetical protein
MSRWSRHSPDSAQRSFRNKLAVGARWRIPPLFGERPQRPNQCSPTASKMTSTSRHSWWRPRCRSAGGRLEIVAAFPVGDPRADPGAHLDCRAEVDPAPDTRVDDSSRAWENLVKLRVVPEPGLVALNGSLSVPKKLYSTATIAPEPHVCPAGYSGNPGSADVRARTCREHAPTRHHGPMRVSVGTAHMFVEVFGQNQVGDRSAHPLRPPSSHATTSVGHRTDASAGRRSNASGRAGPKLGQRRDCGSWSAALSAPPVSGRRW